MDKTGPERADRDVRELSPMDEARRLRGWYRDMLLDKTAVHLAALRALSAAVGGERAALMTIDEMIEVAVLARRERGSNGG
jgi:hypothetical protein